MRIFLLVMTILLGVASCPTARADPFTGSNPLPAPARTGTAFLVPGGVIRRLAHIQMQLNDKIGREFRLVRDGGSSAAFATILALAFLYGVVHAAGPGHGKTVVGSYFVAHDARWFTGLFLGGLIAVLQGVTAIVMVFLLSLILHAKELQVANQGALVDCVSYGIVTTIGAVLLWRTATERGCGHSHILGAPPHHHGTGHGAKAGERDHGAVDRGMHSAAAGLRRGLIAVTGVAPCASAIIIMLFALANDAMGVGVAAVLALSLGMAVTVSSVGVLSVVARRVLMQVMQGSALRLERAERILRLLGSTAIVAFAGLLTLGALSRL